MLDMKMIKKEELKVLEEIIREEKEYWIEAVQSYDDF